MSFTVDLPSNRISPRQTLSLDGKWQYLADPRPSSDDITEEAVDLTRQFPGRIEIPGCWQGQTGQAAARAFRFNSHRNRVWYRRIFHVPGTWTGQRMSLRLGGVLPAADVWLNGKHVGMTLSSRCPVRADVTALIRPGDDNDLAICIFRPALRLDGVFEWLVGGWEGIYRSVQIECHSPTWISDLFVHGDAEADFATACVRIAGSPASKTDRHELQLSIYGNGENRPRWIKTCSLAGGKGEITVRLPTNELPRWTPDSPKLCRADAELHVNGEQRDRIAVPFGIRSLHIKGKWVMLNGKPVTLRGCGDNQAYPETISPPNSVDFYRERLKLVKSFGFNLVHAYDLFTEEYLSAADEVGVMVLQTMPFGVVNPVRSVRKDPGPEWRRLFRRELDNIVSSQRTHPSLACFSMAGELYFNAQSKKSFHFFNRELPARTRRLAPHILVMDANETGIATLETRHGRRDSDLDEILYFHDALRYAPPPKTSRPAIAHEYAWWSSYPDIEKKKLYRRLPMEPYWLEEAAIAARRAGLSRELPRFVRNSRTIQALLRKEGFEKARLFGLAGYLHWLFFDGLWAVEGIVDDFGNPHNVSPGEMREYNSPTILIWDDRNERTYYAGKSAVFSFAIASDEDLSGYRGLRLDVKFRNNGRTWFSKSLPLNSSGKAGAIRLQELTLYIPMTEKPEVMDIEARLVCPGRVAITSNRWRFWVFPHAHDFKTSDGIHVVGGAEPDIRKFLAEGSGADRSNLRVSCDRLNEEDICHLEKGGRILLISDQALPYYKFPDTDVFRTVPWNRGNSGHSGTVVESHPALGDFPHDGLCDYSFVNLVIGGWPEQRTWPFNLDVWRHVVGIKPIIRLVDHYRAARNEAYMFEVRVGAGRLLATCLRIGWGMRTSTPESRYLLRQMVEYARSEAFRPKASVAPAELRRILNEPSN